MHNFALSNVFFYLKPGDTKLNSRPLTFEVQNFDANKYLFNTLSPMSTSGALPFESYEFRKEHFTLLTQSTFHKPYTRLMYPKIENSYLNLLNTFFYNREVDTNRFTDAKNIFVSFSLNFSSKLNAGTWSKISGEITWGNNTIPWTWTKNETSQLHWQTEINVTDWIATMNRSVPLELKILEWHVETPYGVKIFNQEYLDTLTPFYVLSSSDVIAGWHNPRYPLPAEAISQRPTNSVTSAPWYFFKIENTDRSQTSFWLKEQVEDEIEWIKNPVPLKFEISRTPEDQKYLPLPLNPSIRSLKIHFKTQKYIYPRYVS